MTRSYKTRLDPPPPPLPSPRDAVDGEGESNQGIVSVSFHTSGVMLLPATIHRASS